MITDGLLWITRPDLSAARLGGMTVLERQLFTASRAGLRKVWVPLRQPDPKALAAMRLPEGLEVVWSQRSGGPIAECVPPFLTLSGDHLVRPEVLKAVAAAPYRAAAELEDAGSASVIQVTPTRSDKIVGPARQPMPPGACVFLEKPAGGEAALRWLLAGATRGGDGFMARNFDRRISLSISRLLLDTPASPNLMTVVSTAIGLAGAALFAFPSDSSRLAGAALVWLHSVVDGCDGELSRLRFQESAFGADLDFWGDNLVHLALFLCLGLGFHRERESLLPLLLGACAAAGSLGSAAVAFQKRLEKRRSPAAAEAPVGLAKLEDALAQRDFIYLLLVLAYLGYTYPFLWASAIGSIAFFVMTLQLGRTNR